MVVKAGTWCIRNSTAVVVMANGNRLLGVEVKDEFEDGIKDGKSATVCTTDRTMHFVEVGVEATRSARRRICLAFRRAA